MSDFTYRPQQVDYLGFLEAQLRDLRGVDRLAYELIQNADDVQPDGGGAPPTRLTFDVTDKALIVENDGVFRPVDFQRLQRIASGGKRDEPQTTGAFGLGFIAVYQVTDAPEIFSNNLHWVIRPDAPPDRRIQERPQQTEGTRFVLPWAFDPASPVRRALRIEAIDAAQLDALAGELARAIGLAAYFLKQLGLLEVRRNGELIRGIERDKSHPRRLVLREADGAANTWLLFQGDFDAEAKRLRAHYAAQIETARHSNVTVAIAQTALPDHGRLFAVLPTEATMPLPVYVNADFFPTTDRRRVHFGGGYQARWNEAALASAATIPAQHLNEIRQELSAGDFWRLLQGAHQTRQLAQSDDLPAALSSFWEELAPHLTGEPIIYTSDGHWSTPAAARIAPAEADLDLLQQLRIAVVHPQLSPYLTLMRGPQVGVADLSLHDLSQALRELSLQRGTTIDRSPPFLRTLESWRALWRVIDALLDALPRYEHDEQVLRHLAHLPLVLDDMMALRSLRRVFRGDAEAKMLFPGVPWMHPQLEPDAFPGRFVSRFGARQAVDYLADQTKEQLEGAWRMGRLDPTGLFRWFESHPIEIFSDDPGLQREIRQLPIYPHEGELRPLAHLYIPGGFEDPLQLAGVVDLEAIGGRRQFLRDLGLQELDFETYVHEHLPRVLSQDPDLPSDARHRLLHLLAQRLGQIRDDGELREELGSLPLIPCMDGAFRPAQEVYASRQAAELAGPQAHVAEPAETDALAALYNWLGLRREPGATDLVQRLCDLAAEQKASRQPLSDDALQTVWQCWDRLGAHFARGRLAEEELARLRQNRTLPNRLRVMSQPDRLLFVDQPDLLAHFAAAGELDRYLLLAEGSLPALMSAAGVHYLSSVLKLDVSGGQQALPARAIEQRLQARRPLIARLLSAEADSTQDPDPLGFLVRLRVLQLPALQFSFQLSWQGQRFATEPQAQAAVYVADEHSLYVEVADEPPWAAVARELAAIIVRASAGHNGSPAGLALGIREVLAAPTYDDAANILDELGYP